MIPPILSRDLSQLAIKKIPYRLPYRQPDGDTLSISSITSCYHQVDKQLSKTVSVRAGVTTMGRKVISGIVEILCKLGLGDDSVRGVLIRPQWTLHPRSLHCAVCKGKGSLGRY